MKLNISYPATGSQKVIEIEDETQLRAIIDKRMSHEIEGETIDQKFKGYIFQISGGNDKQGFPMMQGVLTSSRVRLLFDKGMKCFRVRKRGERKRKSVRGCIVSSEIAVVNLVIVRKGEQEIEGITDVTKPRRLGPKRASKIRKLFNLKKDDDVRQFVVRRKVELKVVKKDGDDEEGEEKKAAPAVPAKKPRFKAVRIQRLITPERLHRKRAFEALKKSRYVKSKKEAEEYNKLLNTRLKEKRAERESKLAKKRSLSRLQSGAESKDAPKKEAPKKEAPKKEAPKKEAPKKEAPKKEAPKKEAAKDAKKEAPKKEAAKEAPKKEAPKKEAAKDVKKEAPKKEAPKAAPAKEAPKAAPAKEAPKEAPKKEAPKKEAKKEAAAPKAEKSKKSK